MGRIDIAWFECSKCGHRCTPPDVINIIPHEMEKYGEVFSILNDNLELNAYRSTIQNKITELQTEHQGNIFTAIESVKTNFDEVIKDKIISIEVSTIFKINRSYAKVLFQSDTELVKSKEITLGCPQCDAVLYEVKFDR